MSRTLYDFAAKVGSVHQKLVERSALADIRIQAGLEYMGVSSPTENFTSRACELGANVLALLFNLQGSEEIRQNYGVTIAAQYVNALNDASASKRTTQ